MATVVIPAPPPAVPALDADPAASTVSSALRQAGRTTTTVADWAHDSGAPADWSGDAAEAAQHVRSSFGQGLDVVVAVIGQVASACERYESAITGLSSQRETLIDERGALVDRQSDFARRAASYTEDEEAGLVSESTTLQTDIDAYVERVETWQTSLTRAEDALIAAFQSVDTAAEADRLAAAQSQGVQAAMDRLIDRGVLPDDVRGMDSTQLRQYLIDHPDVARDLLEQQPMPGADGPEGLLAGLVQPAFTTPDGAGALHDQRREDARALFEGLSPADASLLATLFPGTVGNLPGVPFEYRADANTVAVVVALDDEQANLGDLQDQHEHHQSDGDLFGLNNDDLEGDISDAEDRIELYQSILDDDRQIILFDPSGDGSIAELHGDIDADTHNVGVSVPGTTTDMSSYQGVADKSEGFVDASDGLAMISWMGGDLPDDVIQDAPFSDYSENLGPVLADFSHDVRQEIDHSSAAPNDVQTTYLGHSYGGAVVGRAELDGLDADRVLHVESAGMGHDIQSPDDLPDSQQDVDRYSMTAPGDIIGDIQGLQLGGDIGHGADPDTFDGTLRLDTGDKTDGTPNIGKDSHSTVFQEHSDAWENMRQVLNGGEVTTYREPEYEDPPWYPYPGWTPEQTGWETPGERVDIP